MAAKQKKIKITEKKSKKPSKKTPKQKALKATKPKQSSKKKDVKKKRLLGILMIILGAFLVVFILGFLYFKLFRVPELAKVLPAEETIGFMEVNIDPLNSQVKDIAELFGQHEAFQKGNLIQQINAYLDLDYVVDIEPFIGRQLGIAFLETKNSSPVVFVDVKDKNLALNFYKEQLNGGVEPEIEPLGYKNDVYSSKADVYMTFVKSYMVLSTDKSSIELIADENSSLKLSRDFDYISVSNNLPLTRVAYYYCNPTKAYKNFSELLVEVFPDTSKLELLTNFIDSFKGSGGTFTVDDESLVVQTFTSVDKDRFKDKKFMHYNKKFQADLIKLIENDALFYTGSYDLKNQIERMSEIFNDLHPQTQEIIEGLIASQIEKYFGEEISLKDDIFEIFDNEYAFSVHGTPESKQYKLILNLTEKQKDRESINKIMKEFVKLSAVYAPKVVDVVLPDGSQGQEIVANPEEIEELTEKYEGYTINIIKVGNKPWGISYAFVDDKAIISSNINLIKESIDLMDNDSTSLEKSYKYKNGFNQVIGVSDEITTMDVESLINSKKDTIGIFYKYVEPFESAISMKNYFDDGIYSLHFLKVK